LNRRRATWALLGQLSLLRREYTSPLWLIRAALPRWWSVREFGGRVVVVDRQDGGGGYLLSLVARLPPENSPDRSLLAYWIWSGAGLVSVPVGEPTEAS
jgi:hypothetical protein